MSIHKKFKPYPGYEPLWKLHMDQNPKGDGESNDEFLNEIKKMFSFDCPENIAVTDRNVPGIKNAPDVRIRIYEPRNSENLPAIINIHGGGFVSGGLNNDDNRIVRLMKYVKCKVISVDYRLSPVNIFPDALEDCYAVLSHIYNNHIEFGIDQKRIAVLGTSAGGCLAASLCLYSRDHDGPKIVFQVLNYPTLDYLANTGSSLQYFDDNPLINGRKMSSVWRMYIGGFDGTLPSYYAVPSLARDLSGLPPTYVIACEYDPLRDESIEYARRLLSFSVQTQLVVIPGVPHGYDLINSELTEWSVKGISIALNQHFRIKS